MIKIDWYCLIIYHISSKRRDFGFPRTYWLKFWSPVTLCLCRGLLCETPAAGFHVSKWKILIRNKTIGQTIVTKRQIFMIICQSLTPKTLFEASLCGMELMANGREITFQSILNKCFTEVATCFKSYQKHCVINCFLQNHPNKSIIL